MDINVTLIGQMITFALFVWFTMKLVWPHIAKALEDRQATIAEGLAAAERGQHDLELAKTKITEQLKKAKSQATEIIDQGHKRADQIVDEAKIKAREEGARLLEVAKADIDKEVHQAKQALREKVGNIAVFGAEKILGRNIDASANSDLLDKLIEEI